MRLSLALLTATLLTGSLAGCTSGYGVPQTTSLSTDGSAQMRFTTGRSPTANVVPVELRSSVILAKIHQPARAEADTVTRGIYGSESRYGASMGYVYAYLDSPNGPPLCSLSVNGLYNYTNIAVDRKGDLLVLGAVGSGYGIIIFKGPGLCGPELGSIAIPPGYVAAYDVASLDAQSGKILVGTVRRAGVKHVGMMVCTLSGGCTANLLIPHVGEIIGVAIAPDGDCWGLGGGVLGYFKHCRGREVPATGFHESDPGFRLDIDANGNLLSTGWFGSYSALYIYSGCNPACTLVGGPFNLNKADSFERLDATSKHFVTISYEGLSVYSYSTTGIRYEYSISNSVDSGDFSAAFSPSSKE